MGLAKFFSVNLLLILSLMSGITASAQHQIDLSGKWSFAFDSQNEGIQQQWFNKDLEDNIMLPGTTDTNQKGKPLTLEPELTKKVLQRLRRKHSYVGRAWYQKDFKIPYKWDGKRITLQLERVIWESTVWIDGQKIGSQNSLVTPHEFDITKYATPGKHTLTICIDNTYKYNIGSHPNHEQPLSHAYTNETQTIWNGMIGDISLKATDPVYIKEAHVYPDINKKKAKLKISFTNEIDSTVDGKIKISCEPFNNSTDFSGEEVEVELTVYKGSKSIEIDYPMGNKFETWDEFNPVLYDMEIIFSGQYRSHDIEDTKRVRFGMREFDANGNSLAINGRKIFLRGTLECCIFPLTGHPPMDVEDWLEVFKTARAYGLNHMRFHSWCPPKAAFEAADQVGFYLQVETPIWVPNIGQEPFRDMFVTDEAERILSYYGNHPSFCMMSIGNELSGDFSFLHNLVNNLKQEDDRHLYTSTTFSFQDEHGRWPEKVDEFFVSQKTLKGWIRGQGFFNQQQPSTDVDFDSSLEGIDVPVISHEIGQYSVYPDLDEIDKYTGVTKPLNFIAVKNDLKEKGRLWQANDYTQASGKFAADLYKAEIELALRSEGLSGFQLLDLHDFPGQGTALVGVLNAFWESKGLIEPSQFRRFCSPTVPLLRINKRVYTEKEIFSGELEILNYASGPLQKPEVKWSITSNDGILANGNFDIQELPIGRTSLGSIEFPLKSVEQAQKLNVSVEIENTQITNDWDIWVYPSKLPKEKVSDDLIIADSITENVENAINNGGKVLLLAEPQYIKDGIKGRFVPVFWSAVHFSDQPGTLSIMCDPKHEAFKYFPTEPYSTWQWWDLNVNSTVMKLDDLPSDIQPIVQIVDNFARNSKLATVFEARVGKAKMLVCSIDLTDNIQTRPVARQLRHSLVKYVQSDVFAPEHSLTEQQLNSLFRDSLTMANAKVKSVDSFAAGYEGSNAIDGNIDTIWHSSWSQGQTAHPHHIIIDLGKTKKITELIYTPRQDGKNGWVKDYEIYLSKDENTWEGPVAKGTFRKNKNPKTVALDGYYQGNELIQTASGRYVKFVALNGFGQDKYTSIAEFSVVSE